MTDDEKARMDEYKARIQKFEDDAADAAKARRTFNYQALIAIIGSGLTLLVARVPH